MFYQYTIEYVNKDTGQITKLNKAFTTWTELASTCRNITRAKHDILTIKFNNYE